MLFTILIGIGFLMHEDFSQSSTNDCVSFNSRIAQTIELIARHSSDDVGRSHVEGLGRLLASDVGSSCAVSRDNARGMAELMFERDMYYPMAAAVSNLQVLERASLHSFRIAVEWNIIENYLGARRIAEGDEEYISFLLGEGAGVGFAGMTCFMFDALSANTNFVATYMPYLDCEQSYINYQYFE